MVGADDRVVVVVGALLDVCATGVDPDRVTKNAVNPPARSTTAATATAIHTFVRSLRGGSSPPENTPSPP